MARNTSVSLGDHFTKFIEDQVESGRYATASDVIRDALRLMETQRLGEQWLRQRMADAEAQVRSGRTHVDGDEFWTSLNADVDERVRRGDRPGPDVIP